MGEHNHGIVEVYMQFETYSELGGKIKDEWKWKPVLNLDFLGKDYTIAQQVFGDCEEKSIWADDIPKDSSVWLYKHDYNWMDATYRTLKSGKEVLYRLDQLIDNTDPNDIDFSWSVLQHILEYYLDWDQVEGREHYVRCVFWMA